MECSSDDEYIFEEEIVEKYEEFTEDLKQAPLPSSSQQQIVSLDSMNLKATEAFLRSVPGKEVADIMDEEEEWEEYIIPDVITPIRRSIRLSLYPPPRLGTIEDSSERSGTITTSKRSSTIRSKIRQEMMESNTTLPGIKEETKEAGAIQAIRNGAEPCSYMATERQTSLPTEVAVIAANVPEAEPITREKVSTLKTTEPLEETECDTTRQQISPQKVEKDHKIIVSPCEKTLQKHDSVTFTTLDSYLSPKQIIRGGQSDVQHFTPRGILRRNPVMTDMSTPMTSRHSWTYGSLEATKALKRRSNSDRLLGSSVSSMSKITAESSVSTRSSVRVRRRSRSRSLSKSGAENSSRSKSSSARQFSSLLQRSASLSQLDVQGSTSQQHGKRRSGGNKKSSTKQKNPAMYLYQGEIRVREDANPRAIKKVQKSIRDTPSISSTSKSSPFLKESVSNSDQGRSQSKSFKLKSPKSSDRCRGRSKSKSSTQEPTLPKPKKTRSPSRKTSRSPSTMKSRSPSAMKSKSTSAKKSRSPSAANISKSSSRASSSRGKVARPSSRRSITRDESRSSSLEKLQKARRKKKRERSSSMGTMEGHLGNSCSSLPSLRHLLYNND